MTHPLWISAPADAPVPPPDFLGLVGDFLAGLREIFGGQTVGLHLFGAAVFPRPDPWRLDVDFHVLLESPPDEARRNGVRALHSRLNRDWPLGEEMDGHYLLVGDAGKARDPDCQLLGTRTGAWALHRAHFLAGRLLVVSGPDPRELIPAPTWPELLAELGAELDYVRAHPRYPAYGILNACRILRSLATRDVVHSKAASADWGRAERPDWSEAIDAAVREYTGEAREGDGELLRSRFPAVLAAAKRCLSEPTPRPSREPRPRPPG